MLLLLVILMIGMIFSDCVILFCDSWVMLRFWLGLMIILMIVSVWLVCFLGIFRIGLSRIKIVIILI